MSKLKEKIQEDLKEAVRNKKELPSSVLRMLLAVILNKEKEKRYKLIRGKPDLKEQSIEKESRLTDEETVEVISSEAKKRKEAIFEYEKGQRPELAEKEKKELEILRKYMPEQLSAEEVKRMAEEAIKEVGADSPKDTGKVMAQLMLRVKGRAEGGMVSGIVKELLASSSDNN